MQQLGGLDNLMIEGELPDIPMHMSAVMIYDTGGKRGATRLFKAFNERFESLTEEHFPILRCKLESVPLDLDKAYWVEDSHFNLGYHITRIALPTGRNWAALYETFSQFHAQPLDRERPLWQATLVEGLDNVEGIPRGASALFLKIHHAVMDGKSALRLTSAFHSTSAEADAPLLAESMPIEERENDFTPPTWWEKYGRAWWHSIERPVDLATTLLKMLPQLLHTDTDHAEAKSAPLPHLPFNHPISGNRVVGHVRMPLKTLRRLEKKFSVSINDIALCVIAGGMREYLDDLGELPDDDTQTLMPIDIRREGKDGAIGNHVATAKVPLHTTIADAQERLLAIHAATREKKQRTSRDKGKAHTLLDIVDEIHPALILGMGHWLVDSGKIDELPQTVNTVVTNVPGMQGKAWLAGAELLDYLGFGPLAPNMGLFHTVSSTEDHVNISFLSTPEFLGDGADYRNALVDSWSEVSAL